MRSTRLLALATASLLSLSAQAAPIFYASEASFLTATSSLPLSLENFQSYNPGKPPVTSNLTSGLHIASNVTLQFQNNSTSCAGKGRCISFTTPNGGSSQIFTFENGPVNAFGIFLGDLGDWGSTTLKLTTSNGDVRSYNLSGLADANELYFGVVDQANPFASVTMSNSRNGDAVYIDNVRWGKSPVVQQSTAVPEPGMLALLGASLAGVALARRRQA
jgi:hypothetical protein